MPVIHADGLMNGGLLRFATPDGREDRRPPPPAYPYGMIASLQCVVLDCADAAELAGFYGALLGGAVDRPDPRWALGDGWSTLHLDGGLVLAFQRVDDYRPPVWPGSDHPQQFHLDLGVADLDQAQRHALDLGARLLDGGDARRVWRVFADPAGHPFCLVREAS
jgi:catechol 2,3-dioxygenase-like lactoylglutathione lyase family enzyme